MGLGVSLRNVLGCAFGVYCVCFCGLDCTCIILLVCVCVLLARWAHGLITGMPGTFSLIIRTVKGNCSTQVFIPFLAQEGDLFMGLARAITPPAPLTIIMVVMANLSCVFSFFFPLSLSVLNRLYLEQSAILQIEH